MNKFIENLTNAQQLNDHHCHWLVRLRCPGGRTAAIPSEKSARISIVRVISTLDVNHKRRSTGPDLQQRSIDLNTKNSTKR